MGVVKVGAVKVKNVLHTLLPPPPPVNSAISTPEGGDLDVAEN